MNYYPQNNQYNPYNNIIAGTSNGVPASYPYQQQYPYMQTIGGNMQPIGYGYNGGYYTGSYGYNPYAERQRQEIALAQMREQQRQQSDIFKRLYKGSCNLLDIEITPEGLKQFNPQFVQQQDDLSDLTMDQQQEFFEIQRKQVYLDQEKANIAQLQSQPFTNYNPYTVGYSNGYAQMIQDYTEKLEGVGLVEYLDKYAGVEYMNACTRSTNNNTNNIRSLYNPGDYNALLNHHKEGLFGNIFNPNVSIDDQEVRLPTAISEKTRQERRAAFLNAILSNGG